VFTSFSFICIVPVARFIIIFNYFYYMQTPEQLKKIWPWLITILLVIAVFLGLAIIRNMGSNTMPKTITVNGTGEIQAVPDVSRFTITIEETAADAKTALANQSAKSNAVIDALKKAGIEAKDITTQSKTDYPKYEYTRGEMEIMIYPPIPAKQTITGYVSSHTLSVKIRNLELVPVVQQIFVDQKVTSSYGPELSIDDPEALQLQARQSAIIDARDQAKILAKQLGVRLGRIVSFSESDGGYYPMFRGEGATMDSVSTNKSTTPNIAPGEQTITSNVSITYRIK